TAIATDPVGNPSNASEPVSYTVDLTPPEAPSIDPLPPITKYAIAAITGAGEIGSTVELFNGMASLGSVVVGPEGRWSLDVSLGEGQYSLNAVATDPAGNSSNTTDWISCTVDMTAPAAPSIDPLPE